MIIGNLIKVVPKFQGNALIKACASYIEFKMLQKEEKEKWSLTAHDLRNILVDLS